MTGLSYTVQRDRGRSAARVAVLSAQEAELRQRLRALEEEMAYHRAILAATSTFYPTMEEREHGTT